MSSLRIQGGIFHRRRVELKSSIRPTQALLRETLFNWLNNSLEGFNCLDLFAGSGILSWEALSRGARTVCLMEKDRGSWLNLHRQLSALDNETYSIRRKVTLIRADALNWLRKGKYDRKMDLVFLDPPYGMNYLEPSLHLLHAGMKLPHPLIDSASLIYYETDARGMKKIEASEDFMHHRSRRRGQVYFGLLRPRDYN